MASHALEVNRPKMKALKDKHAALEDLIHQAMKSPPGSGADFYLRQLKKQKLALKDSIEQLA